MKKPDRPIASWSDTQLAKWIRHLVKNGKVEFHEHADMRSITRKISYQDALRSVEQGTFTDRQEIGNWESTQGKRTNQHRLKFTREFNSRPKIKISVVAGINEDDPKELCIIITCF